MGYYTGTIQNKGAVQYEKIADVVEEMGQTVTGGCKKIEDGVVSGYKKIENGAAAFPVGIAAGVFGIALAALAYPVYYRTLKKEREKIAPQIIKLTDELMK